MCFAHIYVFTTYVPGVHEGYKWLLDSLEAAAALQAVMSQP